MGTGSSTSSLRATRATQFQSCWGTVPESSLAHTDFVKGTAPPGVAIAANTRLILERTALQYD